MYKLDYTNKLYDFFLNGVLVAKDIPFIDSSLTQFDQIEIGTDDEADVHFDRLTISHTRPVKLNQYDDSDAGEALKGANSKAAAFENENEVITSPNLLATVETLDADTDTDGDGMSDGEEIANGLNPEVDDAMRDLDGDGYPNIYELRNTGGNPNNVEITPAFTYTVGKKKQQITMCCKTQSTQLPKTIALFWLEQASTQEITIQTLTSIAMILRC